VLRQNLIAALILAPISAAAQGPLTLDDAVRAALANNASLRAARAGVAEAAARTTSARSGYFPVVSFTEGWQRSNQPVSVFSSLLSARRFSPANFAIDALNHPDPVGLFHASLGVEQLIFDGGRQRSAVQTAAEGRTIAEASADEASAALVVNTTQTFGRVVVADAAHRAAKDGVATAREDLARAERQRDAGMATDADVLALVVHVADLQQRTIQAEGDAAIARADLNRLMGAPIESVVPVSEPSGAALEEFGTPPDLSALLSESDAARPEVGRAAAAERLAHAAERQARAALLPRIAVQGGVDLAGTQFGDRASAWVVGGELRWSFSTAGAELAGMKAASASIARARAEADDARAAVHVDVVGAVRRLETARARLQLARATIEQARESQRIVRDRFDAGLAPVNDVLRTSTAVLDAEAASVSALVDVTVASAMLRRAVGRAR
jgi:outer membrane protein